MPAPGSVLNTYRHSELAEESPREALDTEGGASAMLTRGEAWCHGVCASRGEDSSLALGRGHTKFG
jgi:hypothetical protein